MSMDMVMGLAFLDGAVRVVEAARAVLVVIGGIVLKAGNEGTRGQGTSGQGGEVTREMISDSGCEWQVKSVSPNKNRLHTTHPRSRCR